MAASWSSNAGTQAPDLVITDIKMPDMDGIEAAIQIYRDRPVPVILVSAFHDPELIQPCGSGPHPGYLVKPIKQADLEPAIALAMRRFEQFRNAAQEAADLRQALEDRKIIERAKGILMKKAGLDEPTPSADSKSWPARKTASSSKSPT